MVAGFWGSMVCWLVFIDPWCAGLFLLNEGVLAGFEQPWCAGWFLVTHGALAGFY